MERAREELELDLGEFEVALQLAELRTVPTGAGRRKVPYAEVERLRAEEAFPQALRRRVAVVGSVDGSELIGISRDRFAKLAKGGLISPVRWYANRYRAVVWLYLADDVRRFARDHPGLLTGRLPADLREALAEGEDHRARSWRARRAAGFLRQAADGWSEAAVWAELLGPEATAQTVPDLYERTYLRRLRPGFPPGGTGSHAPREVVEATVVADHPDEIAAARARLTEALDRARAERAAPHPEPPPEPPPELSPGRRPEPPPGPQPEAQALPFAQEPPGRSAPPVGPASAQVPDPDPERRGWRRLLRRR
ncbi:DUF6397 family protein [Streptomyces sp. NBC_01537]|uniref:DUF6397 family protein n=1 Tax=Streptomyces sp. NBC_01537 TaxID=2903896 RepID=UPI003864B6D8